MSHAISGTSTPLVNQSIPGFDHVFIALIYTPAHEVYCCTATEVLEILLDFQSALLRLRGDM